MPPCTVISTLQSPIDAGQLIVATETTAPDFTTSAPTASSIRRRPHDGDLVPDTSTPFLVGNKLFGCSGSLYCLDVSNRLAVRWNGEDDALANHSTVIAANDRVLVATNHGELLLVDAEADKLTIVSRLRVFPMTAKCFRTRRSSAAGYVFVT